MKKKAPQSLRQCLLRAKSKYNPALLEEQGGFILKETDKENYEFVPITNQNTGTLRARSLYIADTNEFNNKVALRTLDDEWSVFASYHTHPVGCRALPSTVDISLLFTSFPINFIYSPDKELNRFDFDSTKVDAKSAYEKWKMTVVKRFNGFDPDKDGIQFKTLMEDLKLTLKHG